MLSQTFTVCQHDWRTVTGPPASATAPLRSCSRPLFMADYLADPRKAYGFCGLGALQRPQVLRHNSSNYGGVLFTDPRKRGENASKDAQLAGVCVLTIMAEYFARANDGVSAKRSSWETSYSGGVLSGARDALPVPTNLMERETLENGTQKPERNELANRGNLAGIWHTHLQDWQTLPGDFARLPLTKFPDCSLSAGLPSVTIEKL